MNDLFLSYHSKLHTMLGAYLVFGIARIGQSLGKVIVRIILENNWKEYSACPTMELKIV